MTKRRVHPEPRQPWHPAEIAQLAAQYPHMKTAVIALMLDRTRSTVYQTAARLGLAKSREFYENPASGRTCGRQGIGYRFVKGHVPINKGVKRGRGWAPGRMASTQFKKGERRGIASKLWRPIGTERLCKDGYLERKVNDDLPLQRRWKAVHRIVWEDANGPTPKGHAVCFINGDKSDRRLENLHLIARRDLMKRNSVHNLPKALAEVVQLRGALQRQINRREKKA